MLQGFGGQLDEWLARKPPAPTIVERLDAMIAARDCPPATVVFVDAWTSRGGSQFLNSTSTGRYLDYVCDEVVPFVDSRYPTLAAREHRGVSGKSSGGYGAMVISMLRPDVFGALASHAGDALFESCYLPLFPAAARLLRDRFEGSWKVFEERVLSDPGVDWEPFAVLFAAYGTGCAYTPDPDRPGTALMPFGSTRGARSRRSGGAGWRWIRCVWPQITRTLSAACGGSTSMRAARTSSSSTSVLRPSRPSSRAWVSRTPWSYSMGATSPSPTVSRARCASSCSRSANRVRRYRRGIPRTAIAALVESLTAA
jgi:hypothetical protein